MDIRYAAGLFDGEGYVRIATWRKPNSVHTRYQVYGGINMCHRPVIEALQQKFGGNMPNPGARQKPHHRPLYTWNFSSQVAARFLRRVLPYLIVKREEAELALELQANIDEYRFKLGNQYWLHSDREAIFARRAEIAAQVKALKHRIFPLTA
jgi:hypothetical protein